MQSLINHNGPADAAATLLLTHLHASSIDDLRRTIAGQADHLVKHYHKERARLLAVAPAAATVGPDGRLEVSSRSRELEPIRLPQSDLLIEWIRMTFNGKTCTGMQNIVVRNKHGDYKVPFLLQWAQSYESDLVAQTESAAAILRARWRALADIGRGARVLRKTIRTTVA